MELTLNSLILDAKIAIASVIDDSFVDYPTIEEIREANKNEQLNNTHFFRTKYKICDTPWYIMTRIDDEFAEFAKTPVGISRFIRLYATVIENEDEYISYFMGRLHSFAGLPAIDLCDFRMWAKRGFVHRDDDLPAVVSNTGETWYRYHKIHRDGDNPAVITDKTVIYYKNGKKHRDGDRPAEIHKNDVRIWFKDGKKHRDGGKHAYIHRLPDGRITGKKYIDGVRVH